MAPFQNSSTRATRNETALRVLSEPGGRPLTCRKPWVSTEKRNTKSDLREINLLSFEEAVHGVGWASAQLEPVCHALGFELDGGRFDCGVVVAEFFNKTTVAREALVCHDDVEEGAILIAVTL
jgi:hypothetical protein